MPLWQRATAPCSPETIDLSNESHIQTQHSQEPCFSRSELQRRRNNEHLAMSKRYLIPLNWTRLVLIGNYL